MRFTSITISAAIHGVAAVALIFSVTSAPESDMVGSVDISVMPCHISEDFEEADPVFEDEIWPEKFDFPEHMEPVLPAPNAVEEHELEALESAPSASVELWEALPLTLVGQRVSKPEAEAEAEPSPPPPPRISAPARARRASPAPGRPKTKLRPISTPHYYPESARTAGIEGTAKVQLTIAANGAVVDARIVISSGYPVLDNAALSSARKWRFYPVGEPRRVNVPFTYRLI